MDGVYGDDDDGDDDGDDANDDADDLAKRASPLNPIVRATLRLRSHF